MELFVNNVNQALPKALLFFRDQNEKGLLRKIKTRGSIRWVYPEPWTTHYQRPKERVLFNAVRDANPVFHLMDALWMLARRNDVAWLAQFLPSIADYSDDGITFHGAYGKRMLDQVENAIIRLGTDPDNSRTVIALYNASEDMQYCGLDMPCNTTIYLGIYDSRLEMTVCNRSNDLILGAYGANAVQFSMLQEFMAFHIGVEVGRYTQFSNNTHLYPGHEATERCFSKIVDSDSFDDYYQLYAETLPLIEDGIRWGEELSLFFTDKWNNDMYSEPFFQWVARPLRRAYEAFRLRRDFDEAYEYIGQSNIDWLVAMRSWLRRRQSVDKVLTAAGVR